ncbi:restriction endonuclease subunit S [Streptomyces sp. SID8352]|uniref:restriction endonuclease subunit S n=1 Tax=Streptomyces sp. SID8352 TaxID=2690338 RepID=UPI00192749A9|nr:restriction endonuclease subunit S [Streptomyces sp. SID8352]
MSSVLGISLPGEWSSAPLKHVTTYLNRGSAPTYVDEGPVRAVSQAANQNAGLDWTRTRFHDFNGDPRKLKGFLRPDDVLINSTGTGTLGRVGYFDQSPDGLPCMADSHVTVARSTRGKLDPRFMYYWLSSRPFQGFVHAALVVGATNQIELNRDRLGDAPVPLPEIEEQCRIAAFLDVETARIDRLVILQRSVLRKIDEREATQLDLEIDELVERHGAVPLRRFLLGVDQGTSPQCDAVPAADDEWGVLKVSCLRPGNFVPAENKRLPEGTEPDSISEVREGDLLIVRANTPQLVGSTAVVPKVRRRLLLSDKIFRVRLDDRLSADFVAAIARGRRIRALCSAGSNGASQSMANIRFEEVKAWPMPAVGPGAQADFVAKVANGRAVLDKLHPRIERQLALFAERRQALITAAVTGQFDVSTASGRNVTEGITV